MPAQPDTRFAAECRRLFDRAEGGAAVAPALDADGRTRTLVLGLQAPADWDRLGGLWRQVQAELGWPAPAIVANGRDGLELWFALAQAVEADVAAATVQALRDRYLADLPPPRWRAWPSAPVDAVAHATRVPARQPGDDDRWSAFVTPDLAPLFADTPWLDLPPGDDAQAQVLAAVRAIDAEAWQRGRTLLKIGSLEDAHRRATAASAAAPAAANAVPGAVSNAGSNAASALEAGQDAQPPTGPSPSEPQAFLLSVMRDEGAPLALRVEAAKALLPYRDPGASA